MIDVFVDVVPGGTAPPSACTSSARRGLPSVRKRSSATDVCAAGNSAFGAGTPNGIWSERQTVACWENSCQTYVRIGVLPQPMLRFLRISHLAVIDSVEVEFGAGLTVLTGETGAGKSILVEAVGLLLGGRASGDLVRTGEDSASIEAIFESGDDELLVRRELTAQGRSRAFINGSLATAGQLKELAARLIEIHGQHEHHTLLDPATHVAVLDAYGQHESHLAPVRERFAVLSALRDEKASLEAAMR